jgi:GMP synthase-like glutamine amidotransferase
MLGREVSLEAEMRAHYLQHVPFEGLGYIESWLRAKGYPVTGTKFFESTRLPSLDEFDMLIVMGGPMSANDESTFPWLGQEKEFIRKAIGAGKSILGICLGAQLIASAMGARVFPNPVKEIGWWPVQGIQPANELAFRFPPLIEVFHWHGETFELPPGAIHLAKSEGCENQAFQLGRSVIGLQFHLETTPELVQGLVSNCCDELLPSTYVQSEAEILSASPEKYQAINCLMGEVLSFLCRCNP